LAVSRFVLIRLAAPLAYPCHAYSPKRLSLSFSGSLPFRSLFPSFRPVPARSPVLPLPGCLAPFPKIERKNPCLERNSTRQPKV